MDCRRVDCNFFGRVRQVFSDLEAAFRLGGSSPQELKVNGRSIIQSDQKGDSGGQGWKAFNRQYRSDDGKIWTLQVIRFGTYQGQYQVKLFDDGGQEVGLAVVGCQTLVVRAEENPDRNIGEVARRMMEAIIATLNLGQWTIKDSIESSEVSNVEPGSPRDY